MNNDLLQDILKERIFQDKKWGVQSHKDLKWLSILVEEVGEVSKSILEGGADKYELIQVAAVALAWLECLARKQESKTI